MNPSFYAIIPANVRYDNNLMPNAKLLYGEITALCNKEGNCWATNDYFSQLYKVSTETISRWVSQLKKAGYIVVVINKLDANKRSIFISTPIDEKINTLLTKRSIPIDEKINTSIYMINNTINIPGTGVNFLLENYPIRFEQEFLMKYEKQFNNQEHFNCFLNDFNDEVIVKDKCFGDWMFGMLSKYARNWIAYKGKQQTNNQPTSALDKIQVT